jgi:hypothetical protein
MHQYNQELHTIIYRINLQLSAQQRSQFSLHSTLLEEKMVSHRVSPYCDCDASPLPQPMPHGTGVPASAAAPPPSTKPALGDALMLELCRIHILEPNETEALTNSFETFQSNAVARTDAAESLLARYSNLLIFHLIVNVLHQQFGMQHAPCIDPLTYSICMLIACTKIYTSLVEENKDLFGQRFNEIFFFLSICVTQV